MPASRRGPARRVPRLIGARREPAGDRSSGPRGSRRAPSGPTTPSKGHASYEGGAPDAKEAIVRDLLDAAGPGAGRACWDLGANTGRFSRIAADLGYRVLSFDIDPAAAERHYRALRAAGRTDTTPLVMDLADPSPGLGWASAGARGLRGRPRGRGGHPRARARASPGHRPQRAAAHGAGPVRGPRAPGHRGMGAAWRPHGRCAPCLARGCLRDYTTEGFEAAVATRFDVRARTPIEGSPRVLFHLARR